MKRSDVNRIVERATRFFAEGGWTLPPSPRWDVTDFGLGNFNKWGLVLVNLAEEQEYCEKLMYARKNQVTPVHSHRNKKEDIICRKGVLMIQVWHHRPDLPAPTPTFRLKRNGTWQTVQNSDTLRLEAGERVTLPPGIWHEFYPLSEECIIGEVSTANDDQHDNFFLNPAIGRFSDIEEDEPARVKLVSDVAVY